MSETDSGRKSAQPEVRASSRRRSKGPAVRCRPATLDDYEGIHALELQYGLGIRNYEEWAHLWVNNPLRRGRGDLAIGWVLENEQGQIVGSIGSIPFEFELAGRSLVAGTSSGWVADQSYRSYALLLLDRFLSQPNVDLHLCVSPSAQAEPAVALHSERVPVGIWNRVAFWVTDPRSFVDSTLARQQVPSRRLLRYPMWGAVALREAARPDRLKAALRTAPRREVGTCIAFDERFDAFWKTMRAAQRGRLLAVRTREVLEWHYKRPLAHDGAWIFTVCEGDRLLAYAVFCRKNVAPIGLRRMRLVDYQSLDGAPELFLPMLQEALARCRAERIAVLESIGWQLEPGQLLDRIAPWFRTMASWQYFYRAEGPELASVLRSREVWRPTQYDGDACL